jgi:hypothetical protein
MFQFHVRGGALRIDARLLNFDLGNGNRNQEPGTRNLEPW